MIQKNSAHCLPNNMVSTGKMMLWRQSHHCPYTTYTGVGMWMRKWPWHTLEVNSAMGKYSLVNYVQVYTIYLTSKFLFYWTDFYID